MAVELEELRAGGLDEVAIVLRALAQRGASERSELVPLVERDVDLVERHCLGEGRVRLRLKVRLPAKLLVLVEREVGAIARLVGLHRLQQSKNLSTRKRARKRESALDFRAFF
eukprot:4189103-Prymnesium_polylepis.1